MDFDNLPVNRDEERTVNEFLIYGHGSEPVILANNMLSHERVRHVELAQEGDEEFILRAFVDKSGAAVTRYTLLMDYDLGSGNSTYITDIIDYGPVM